MPSSHHSFDMDLHNILSLFLLIFATHITTTTTTTTAATNPSHAAAATATETPSDYKATELVNQVCRQTSSYKFCVDSLYSDPRTPDADSFALADISFRLAYRNATKTQDHITQLLNISGQGHDRENLLTCQRDYKTAINRLASALNDLNSETFFTLAGYANDTASAADDCRAHYPPLTTAARDLKSLCEICVVVSKLFTGSSKLLTESY